MAQYLALDQEVQCQAATVIRYPAAMADSSCIDSASSAEVVASMAEYSCKIALTPRTGVLVAVVEVVLDNTRNSIHFSKMD